MKRLLALTVMVLSCQGMHGLSQTVPDKPDPDIALGLREWPPITNGLVFIDGEYLLPPYTVTRNEANIYINGRRVETVIKWPPHKRPTSPVPEKDIAMPSSINDKTTQYDYSFINYVNYKKEYLFAKYGQKMGIEKMVEVYRSLPCVKDAQFNSDNPNCITVVWNTGEICNINQMTPQRQEDDLTVEQAKHMVDKVATIYVRGLDDSNYFIFGNATMRGTMDSYQRVLRPLSEALRTSVDEKAFITAIRTNQLFSGFSDTANRSFFKHKDDVPKWESKISKQLPVTEEPGTRQPPQVP